MRTAVLVVLALVSIAIIASPASAQMQMGGQQAAMEAAHAGMQHGAMMQADQMMRNVDQMMAHATSMMRDLANMQASMQHMAQHNPMTTTMQAMLDNMKQMHGQLHDIMKDHMLMQNTDVMKGFHEACKSLQDMAACYQAMTKNVMTIMKATAPKK